MKPQYRTTAIGCGSARGILKWAFVVGLAAVMTSSYVFTHTPVASLHPSATGLVELRSTERSNAATSSAVATTTIVGNVVSLSNGAVVDDSSVVPTDTFVNVVYPHCSVADRGTGVLLVGNRPVGTYLCEYFPRAKRIRGGCALSCEGVAVGSESSPQQAAAKMTCSILAKGSVEQLKTADIVVNHHGPVPFRHRPEQITLFYSGESNKSEGKKGTQKYQQQYSDVISFHHHRRFYFTWTHRFADTFQSIAAGKHRFPTPTIDAIIIFVSRCGKGGRDGIIRRLMKAYEVRSFGSCVRTHRVAETHPECANPTNRYKEKECVFSKYRFALALDNTVEEDYVTEKVYHSLVFGPVPIYDGAPNVDDFLPSPQSIIRLRDFVPSGGDFRENPDLIDVDALRKKLTETAAQGSEAPEWKWRHNVGEWPAAFLTNMAHAEPTCAMCAEALNRRCQARKSSQS